MKLNIQYLRQRRIRLWRTIFNISILILFFYFLLSLFLYSPVLTAFFVSDDFDWLARAKNIPLTFENYFLNNTDAAPGGGVYRPLTSLSFWLNYQVSGLAPRGYHLVNIIFHALNAFLVFWVVLILSLRGPRHTAGPAAIPSFSQKCMGLLRNDFLLPFLAGFFFTILPNHPEAVSWISGRNDVLTTFFYLLSLILYVYFRRTQKSWFFSVSLLVFALALLSKETAITLPLILVIYEVIWHFKRSYPTSPHGGGVSRSPSADKNQQTSLGQQILYLFPFVILLSYYLVIRFYATGLFYGSYSSASLNFTWPRAMDTFIGGLVSHFFSGSQHLVDIQRLNRYGYWVIGAMTVVIFIFIKVMKSVCPAKLLKNQLRMLLFSVLFFIFSLAPVYYLKFNHLTGEGERFFYLPSVGVAVLLALLISNILNIQYFKKIICLVIFWGLVILSSGYFGFLLCQKNLVWQKAGQLSQSLLVDFAHETNLQAGEGTVILGMPDNIQGAPVFRNGWLAASRLFYPYYHPDVLVAKAGLNLTAVNFNQKIIDWVKLIDGYAGLPLAPGYLFYGAKNLKSADYQMTINDYETSILSGQQVEIYFTPRFLQQLPGKKIIFLVFDQGHLNATESPKTDVLDGF